MDVKIIKGEKRDYIMLTLANGLPVETTFPKKGPFPHDAVHYAVEKHLGLTKAFWGMVACGRHPEEIGELAKAAGHASASRATVPGDNIVELLQAERIVECFEADMWSGPATPALIRQSANVACESSFVPPLALTDKQISLIRSELAQLSAQWTEGRIAFGWAE